MQQQGISFPDAFKIAIAFAVVGVGLLFIYTISDVLLMFLAAFIFAIALDRPLDAVVRRGYSRWFAVISMYASFLAVVTVSFIIVVPPLAMELRGIYTELTASEIAETLVIQEEVDGGAVRAFDLNANVFLEYMRMFADLIPAGSQTIAGTFAKISGTIITFLVIFFVSLFLNLQKDGFHRFITVFVPVRHRKYASNFLTMMRARVGAWLWGKALSSLFVAVIIYLGLFLLGVPYAMTFAVMTLFLNFIPFIGPVLASILPIVFAFMVSPVLALAVLLLYFITNTVLESFVFVPLLMSHAIKMSPVLLVFAVLVGGYIGGILGIIISIPVAAILTLAYDEYRSGRMGAGGEEPPVPTPQM